MEGVETREHIRLAAELAQERRPQLADRCQEILRGELVAQKLRVRNQLLRVVRHHVCPDVFHLRIQERQLLDEQCLRRLSVVHG